MVVSGKIVWRFDAGVFSYQTGDPVDQTGLAWQRPKRAAGKLAVKSRGCNHIKNRFFFFCNQSQFAQMLKLCACCLPVFACEENVHVTYNPETNSQKYN